MQKAVVSTSVGCEGLSVVPGKHLIVADQPEAFAQAVIALLQNPEMRITYGDAGRKFVEAEYSWERCGTQLLGALEEIRKGMSSMQILRWFLLAAEVWIAVPILYLCVLSVSAILNTRNQEGYSIFSRLHLLMPISRSWCLLTTRKLCLVTLLENLSQLAYPKDQYTVYVVADNCTDNTAELARETGWVRVYERFDEIKRGKGYALNWLLQKLEEDQSVHDAYVIFDADSVVVPTFLQVNE